MVKIPQQLEVLAHGNAGAFAGLISTFVLYPFENIKTRMHVVSKEESKTNHVEGLVSTIQKVLQSEGVAGFYKGMTPLLMGNYLSYGVYFFWYEYFKAKLHITAQSSLMATIKPSFLSAVVTTVITNPFWVLQSKLTFSKEKLGLFKTCRNMIRSEGLTCFFKGLEASLVLVINPIIQFLIYEIIKKKFKHIKYQQFIHFFGGALSKAIATFVTYPYQVLRTYAHVQSFPYYQISKQKTNYGVLIQEIYKTQGFTGFFRGFTPKLIQTVLNSAFMLTFYEFYVQLIKNAIILLAYQYYKRSAK